MNPNRKNSVGMLAAVLIFALGPVESRAHDAVPQRWSIEVEDVDPGSVGLEPAFKVAIYENLMDTLEKGKRFKQVFRAGDRNSKEASSLLILKTTVENYTPGSETRRAVTTVAGATKLTVRTKLCMPDGQVVLERVVHGNVRLFGSNLRATHTLAQNVANAIKPSEFGGSSPGSKD